MARAVGTVEGATLEACLAGREVGEEVEAAKAASLGVQAAKEAAVRLEGAAGMGALWADLVDMAVGEGC